MLVRIVIGSIFVVIAFAVAGGTVRGLRSRSVRSLPISIRVTVQAVGLVTAGVLVPFLLIVALIVYQGMPIGDPCPPYC
jgi:hypothetical protein